MMALGYDKAKINVLIIHYLTQSTIVYILKI